MQSSGQLVTPNDKPRGGVGRADFKEPGAVDKETSSARLAQLSMYLRHRMATLWQAGTGTAGT
ncbi:MAG: hypothetical protein P4L50_10180 [Anaerolineaceae bacterium]|nr:hypothetical protein [Anaerolineaceae bacterium]